MSEQSFLTVLGKFISLQEDAAALSALATTVAEWGPGRKLEGLSALVASIGELPAKIAQPDVAAAFAAAGLAQEHAVLADLGKELSGFVARIPADLRPLFQPVGDFKAGPAKDSGLIDWIPVKLDGPIANGAANRLTYEIGGSLNTTIAIEAGGKWPYAGDAMPEPLLRIGLAGAVGANGKAALPFSLGSVKLGAAAKADTTLNYYFTPRDARAPYALAVADSLGVLPNPFDYGAVWNAFEANLTGVEFGINGKASFDLAVSIADGFDLGAGVKAEIGATVAVKVARESKYILTLRAGGTPGRREILAVLSKSKASSKQGGLDLGIDLDLAGLAARIHAILDPRLAKLGSGLDKIRPFLSPGTLARDTLKAKLTAGIEALASTDQMLKDALAGDLKIALGLESSDKSALADWLGAKVVGAVNAEAGAVAAEAKTVAQAVLATLGPSIDFLGGGVADMVGKTVEDEIAELQKKLEAEVKALIGDAQAKVQLGRVLKDVGASASSTVGALNTTMKDVRTLFERYDALFKKLVAASKDAARQKISAKISLAEKREASTTYEIAGRFLANDPEAAEIYDRLIYGRFGDLASLKGLSSFVLNVEKSLISRVSERSQTFGVELLVFGFGLKNTDLLTGKAEVVVGPDGLIRLETKGSMVRLFDGPREDQELSFVDTYSIVRAKAMAGDPLAPRSLAVGIAISHRDQSLKLQEVKGLILSLENAGLVPKGTKDKGVDVFEGWGVRGSDEHIAADINVKMQLVDRQPLRLMQLADSPEGPLPTALREHVFWQAISALVRAGDYKESELHDGLSLAKGRLGEHTSAGLTNAQLMMRYLSTPSVQPEADPYVYGTGTGAAEETLAQFLSKAELAKSLVSMIEAMREVYSATPALDEDGPGWTEDHYAKSQQLLAGYTRGWLKVKKKGVFWLAAELHPRLIAFLNVTRILADASELQLSVTMGRAGEGVVPLA